MKKPGAEEAAAGRAAVDAYIAGFPPEIRERLEAMRATVRAALPEATEKIAYQMPTFVLEGYVLHYAAFKGHIGLYPLPTGIEAFKAELAAYKQGKGSVQFPHDRPLPLELVARIALFRAGELSPKAARRDIT